MHNCSKRPQRGGTLVELIIAIVVIGIAASAILRSLGFLGIANVDPQLRSQSNLLAQSLLNEVQSKAYFDYDEDPDLNPGGGTPDVCPAPEPLSGDDRSGWDNVCDYDGYDSGTAGPRHANGNLIDGLGGYRRQVDVAADTGLTLGDLTNQSGCVPIILRIDVTVSGPRGNDLVLSGYRTSYWDEGGGC